MEGLTPLREILNQMDAKALKSSRGLSLSVRVAHRGARVLVCIAPTERMVSCLEWRDGMEECKVGMKVAKWDLQSPVPRRKFPSFLPSRLRLRFFRITSYRDEGNGPPGLRVSHRNHLNHGRKLTPSIEAVASPNTGNSPRTSAYLSICIEIRDHAGGGKATLSTAQHVGEHTCRCRVRTMGVSLRDC